MSGLLGTRHKSAGLQNERKVQLVQKDSGVDATASLFSNGINIDRVRSHTSDSMATATRSKGGSKHSVSTPSRGRSVARRTEEPRYVCSLDWKRAIPARPRHFVIILIHIVAPLRRDVIELSSEEDVAVAQGPEVVPAQAPDAAAVAFGSGEEAAPDSTGSMNTTDSGMNILAKYDY